MEIERKYLVKSLPDNLESYEQKKIAQGYLCTNPVLRIRRSNDEYFLTYKGPAYLKTVNEFDYNNGRIKIEKID